MPRILPPLTSSIAFALSILTFLASHLFSLLLLMEQPPAPARPPTDFGKDVLDSLAVISSENGTIDQRILRYFIGLSPSYLLTDITTNLPNPDGSGIDTWNIGFSRLIDLLLVLHARNELELETLNQASRACSECWTVACAWPHGTLGDQSRAKVRVVAGKLRSILDANQKTYNGGAVYVP